MIRRSSTPDVRAADSAELVLPDANVLFAPRLRDLVMYLHSAKVIRLRWTREIEDEWSRNVVAKHGANREAINKCLLGMRKAVPGWEICGYERYASRFMVVHEKDRHVAAAAYQLALEERPRQAVALVTQNTKDFPSSAFEGMPVVCYPVGDFLDQLVRANPFAVLSVVELCQDKLKAPPVGRQEYLESLAALRCPGLVRALGALWRIDCPIAANDGRAAAA